MTNTRLEHDLLGERNVPSEHYYGIQTLRAVENFCIPVFPSRTTHAWCIPSPTLKKLLQWQT